MMGAPSKEEVKRMEALDAICDACDEDPEDRDGDPCEYCKTWKERLSLEKPKKRLES